jgi:hypothetical protein
MGSWLSREFWWLPMAGGFCINWILTHDRLAGSGTIHGAPGKVSHSYHDNGTHLWVAVTHAAQGIRSRIAISRSMCLSTSSGIGDSPLIHRPTVRRSYPAYSAKVILVQPRRASA